MTGGFGATSAGKPALCVPVTIETCFSIFKLHLTCICRSKCNICQEVNSDSIKRRFYLLRPKHWHKVKPCKAGIESAETKNSSTLFQKACVIGYSQKR